jgi:hypothetical protein
LNLSFDISARLGVVLDRGSLSEIFLAGGNYPLNYRECYYYVDDDGYSNPMLIFNELFEEIFVVFPILFTIAASSLEGYP